MEDKWQPIETAPKDGTAVLLFWPTGNCQCNAANDYEPDWSPAFAVMAWIDASWEGYYAVDPFYDKPTHWLPLPAPPSE